MAKTLFARNDLFWGRRRALGLSRPAVADIANRQSVMGACEHVPLDENYIGRVEQGRIGGGMCGERLMALCIALQVDEPARIGLIADRRPPTSSAPPQRRPRTVRDLEPPGRTSGLRGRKVPLMEDLGFADSDVDMKRRQVVAGLVSPTITALIDAVIRPFAVDPISSGGHPVIAEELEQCLKPVDDLGRHTLPRKPSQESSMARAPTRVGRVRPCSR